MADSVEMQDIRGLDIDKAVKGFALIDYTFKNECTVSNTAGDHIRWYQETSADLTATAPSKVANISPLSVFPTLEPTWTRETSYVRKYAAESFISMEDMKSADIDVVARTLLRLTRAVIKQVDTRIYSVINGAGIQSFSVLNVGGAGWDESSGAIIKDLLHARKLLEDEGYQAQGASLILHPTDMRNLSSNLIDTKGSSIPGWSSEQVTKGTVTSLLGINIKSSVNATISSAIMLVPQKACTWKTFTDTTSRAIDEPGLGTKFRVWELGEAILTDPKAVVNLTHTAWNA